MSFDFDSLRNDTPTALDPDRIDPQDDKGQRGQRSVAIRIDYDVCENSGTCALVCPEDVIEEAGGQTKIARPEACTECWLCIESCSSGAIEIT